MYIKELVPIPQPLQPLVTRYRFLRKLRRGVPVIIYQMGKVGSVSVEFSLKEAGVEPVFHVHYMNPVEIARVQASFGEQRAPRVGLYLFRHVIEKQRRAKIITLVREPVGRNVSNFFQNIDLLMDIDAARLRQYPVEQLMEGFLRMPPSKVPLEWFDREMRPVLNFDVYAHDFPREEGYACYNAGPFEILILKLELPDSVKARAIADFVGLDQFELKRRNIGTEKIYAETYQHFKRVLKLPKTYLDPLLASKYAQHFYTDTEIEQVYERWGEDQQVAR